MPTRIPLLLSLLLFTLPSRVEAAAVDIEVVLSGGTNWSLQFSIFPGQTISGAALLVSDSLTTFTLNPALPGTPPACVLVLDGCDLTPVGSMPGFNLLILTFSPSLVGSGAPVLLGTFGSSVSSAALVQVLPADALVDGTVFDGSGAAIQDFTIRVVPEPAVMALLLSALFIGIRRSGSNRIPERPARRRSCR